MKRKISVIAAFLQIWAYCLPAQDTRFPSSGTIVYEKTINMYTLIRKGIDIEHDAFMRQAFDQYKKENTQLKTLRSVLQFKDNRTLYKPREDSMPRTYFSNNALVEQFNTVFSDYTNGTAVHQKKVYENLYLVHDSLRKNILWKITGETRDIMGYQCRRANGIIFDSVYVVAFYTDNIQIPGGPESFGGLPGMILGVVLPHNNVSWFATSVEFAGVPESVVTAPVKGKETDMKSLRDHLRTILKPNDSYLKWLSL